MRTGSGSPHSASRLFAAYAAVSLVPVILLGLVLANSYRSETARRGLAEARSEAALVSSTAIEPLLNGADLRVRLSDESVTELRQVTTHAVDSGAVVRLRIRDLDGRVVFSSDGTGFGRGAGRRGCSRPSTARSRSSLTTLNADEASQDVPAGASTVEVYRAAGGRRRRGTIGVLEIYLPYAADP